MYLRAWGDYERHTLKLTAHTTGRDQLGGCITSRT
jgi:hypothetical protein